MNLKCAVRSEQAGERRLNDAGAANAEGSSGLVQVWLVELEDAAAVLEAEEARCPRLSSDDLERIAALAAPELQRQRRLSAIALRLLIAAELATDRFDRVPFARTPAGKPELQGAPVSFSLAHAAGRAMLAIAREGPLGVDLEAARTLRMEPERQLALIRAAEAVLPLPVKGCQAEAADGAPDPGSVLQAWVRLEALAKAEGNGVARLLTAAGVMGRSPRQTRHEISQAAGAGDWAVAYTGNSLTVRDLGVPPEASGQPWYAAVAAPAVALGRYATAVQILPCDLATMYGNVRRRSPA